MTEPTEDEIEASSQAVMTVMRGCGCMDDVCHGLPCACAVDLARAALTAAAQVRENADPVVLIGVDLEDGSTVAVGLYATLSDAQFAVQEGRLPPAFYSVMTPAVGATIERRLLTHDEFKRKTKPHLMPIYGATEDQGEDVLGMRKGEEG